MAISRGPKLVTNGLVLALDPSDDNSFAAQNLPIKNGLLLWLDAADDDSFVYSSGTEVSQWRDKSGNNFHANQATTAQQPSRSTVVNSRKSVNFTSANGDFMRVNSGMVFTNSVTAIVFIKPGTQNNAYADILDQDHSMDGYNGWVIQRNNTASQWLVWLANEANTTWLNTNAISYTDNTSQIVTLRKGSSTLTLYSNGTSSGDVAVANQQIRQANYFGLNIGYWRAGAGRYYNGEICEIVVYNRALSLTELNQVHTYLGQKWGILNTDKSIVDASGGTYVGLLGNGTTSTMPVYDFYNKGALKFDGTDDYVVGTVPSIAASSTIGMWIKSANYGGKIPFSIVGANYASGPNIFFSGNFINWNTGDGAGNPFANSSYLDGNWHYMVVTNDAATNAKLYIDGVLIGTAAYRNTLSTNSNNLWLGRFSGDNNYTINANIAGTQIYNRVLSAAEVLQNYNAQKARFTNTIVQSGLILNLDAGNNYSYAGSGTTWYDVSGNGYNGILTNGPVYSTTNSGIIVFDGSNDYVDLTGVTLSLSGNASRSMFAWVKTTYNGNQGFIATGTPAGSQAFILVKYGSYVGVMGYNNDFYPSSGKAIADGIWHYVGVTFDGANLRTYVDGVLDNTSGTITYTTTGQSNYVGRSNHAGNENFINGSMGNAQIYNRTLSATEVLQNYNATKGRFVL
jgi:hypothetical protein